MSTELSRREDLLPDARTWQTMMEMADQLVRSGLLPTAIKSPAAALAIMQKGRELGIPPMYALSNISVINGKPVTGAELMLAMIYRDHGDGSIQFETTDAERCVVLYKRRGWSSPRRFEWTMEDAKRAGLLGKGGTWTQYPPTMLRHRCISAVARLAFPDTIGGLYTHEEMGAEVTVNEQGEVVPVEQPVPVLRTIEAEPVTFSAFSYEEGERAAAEAEYARLAALAEQHGHKQTDKILAKRAELSSLPDGALKNAVEVLQRWERGRQAPDTDQAF